MRICSRCNKEVSNINTTCPNCGFSLLKDKYGKRIEPLNNSLLLQTSKFNNTNQNVKAKPAILVIVIFLVAFASTIIPTIFMLDDVFDDDFNEKTDFNIDLIEEYLYDVRIIASDYELAWTSFLEDNAITLEKIDNDIKLAIDEMTNDSCDAFKNNSKEEDLLDCILLSYEEKDIYDIVNENIVNLYNYVEVYKNGNVRDVLVEIYGCAYDLYYLPGSIKDYEQYKNKYEETITNLDAMLSLLEDKDL